MLVNAGHHVACKSVHPVSPVNPPSRSPPLPPPQFVFVVLLLPLMLSMHGLSLEGLPLYLGEGARALRGLAPVPGGIPCEGAPLLPLLCVCGGGRGGGGGTHRKGVYFTVTHPSPEESLVTRPLLQLLCNDPGLQHPHALMSSCPLTLPHHPLSPLPTRYLQVRCNESGLQHQHLDAVAECRHCRNDHHSQLRCPSHHARLCPAAALPGKLGWHLPGGVDGVRACLMGDRACLMEKTACLVHLSLPLPPLSLLHSRLPLPPSPLTAAGGLPPAAQHRDGVCAAAVGAAGLQYNRLAAQSNPDLDPRVAEPRSGSRSMRCMLLLGLLVYNTTTNVLRNGNLPAQAVKTIDLHDELPQQ